MPGLRLGILPGFFGRVNPVHLFEAAAHFGVKLFRPDLAEDGCKIGVIDRDDVPALGTFDLFYVRSWFWLSAHTYRASSKTLPARYEKTTGSATCRSGGLAVSTQEESRE